MSQSSNGSSVKMNYRIFNENLKHVFKDGRIPSIIYANRQQYGAARHDRPVHSHEKSCELLLCYEGTGIYNIENDRYKVEKGDLVFYNCGERHELISSDQTEIGTYCFGFADVRFSDLALNHIVPENSPRVRSSGSAFSFLCSLADQILEISNNSDVSDRLLLNLLGVSLLLYARRTESVIRESKPVSDTAFEVTNQVKKYINAHYTEPLTISKIAEALSFSPTYISHAFKKAAGYSPIEYAIRCRIGLAETLLISSDYPVTRIAAEVGYDNSNYFQSLFKRIVGMTPLQYRKNYLRSLRGQRDQL